MTAKGIQFVNRTYLVLLTFVEGRLCTLLPQSTLPSGIVSTIWYVGSFTGALVFV